MRVTTAAGYSLIEIVVVISIIGILAALVTRALPTLRTAQNLELAQQQFSFMMREAQRKALNEEREPSCSAAQDTARCADIGVKLENQLLTQFADADGSGEFTSSSDTVITTVLLPGEVAVTSPATFVFRGVPPTVSLLANGREVTTPVAVQFHARNNLLNVRVYPYGQVERE